VIVMGLFKRIVLAVLTVVLVVLSIGVGAAGAMPWWKVRTMSEHATKPGNEAAVLVEVSNLGDTVANKAVEPFVFEQVTVADKLPAGVTPTAIYAEGGGKTVGLNVQGLLSSCSLASTTCTYAAPVMPYERLLVKIDVKVTTPGAGTGTNEVHVSGGVAVPVIGHQSLSLEPLASNGEAASVYGIENYELNPEEEGGGPATQAGSHPFQLTTSFSLNLRAMPLKYLSETSEGQPYAITRDLRFNVPPGLIGNPTPLPECNTLVFTKQAEKAAGFTCPNNTVVGAAVSGTQSFSTVEQVPFEIASPLYSLEPSHGEPARFGFLAAGNIPVLLDTSVRTGSDYGVVVTVPDVPSGLPLLVSQVTFWGDPSDPRHDTARGTCLESQEYGFSYIITGGEAACSVSAGEPFLIMPTACAGPLHSVMEADSWAHPGVFESNEYTFADNEGRPYGLDGCNRLSFEPSIKVAPDGQEASTPTGITVDEHVPQEAELNPKGVAQSTVRNTMVTLPAGVAINPGGADGLSACSIEQAALDNASEPACPDASKVGTVEVSTPLLPNPLVGAAFLAQQDANPFGSLIAMYIEVHDPVSGVRIKVAGEVKPDPVTGQLVSTFDNTPPLPFEDLRLHFFGGSRAPLGTPSLCGSYTTSASIAPWSGNPSAESGSSFEITSGPNHTPCDDPLPFGPELTAGSLNLQAGGFTPFSMTMSREDGNQNLDAIQLKMPPGLLGTLAHVKLCDEAHANAGTCGPESLIGHTVVSVGLGGNPYSVKGGEVFITGPYKGASYGLSVVNPAKAGPFDLGKVVVRAKIEVDPTTAFLTITTDTTGPYQIPQILDGIPLQIKHINVTIDRPEFTINPTNCEPQRITGGLTSSDGSVSALAVPFQVTNCAILKFKPQFTASADGKTSRADGTSLTAHLDYPNTPFGTGANIRYVKVELPKQLPSRLSTLKKACLDSTFQQNPAECPAASRIGSATATTPVLPVSLAGPAYFVSHGGQKFPELIIVLSGYGTTVYLHGETFINKAGITSSTFRQIPDVPVGTFELKLPQGPDSALAANTNLCTATLRMPTTFIAQNGRELHQTTPIATTGCTKHKTKTKHKHKKHKKKK
jgi:hypothetical protein